jgi:hypothetical protein
MTPDALLYAERINAINGESGSGKSWLAYWCAAELLLVGEYVVLVDLEDHPTSVVARFRALGVPDGIIEQQLIYIRPDRPASIEAVELVDHYIDEHMAALVIIDSIGELMALQGVKPNDDDAVAAFYRALPRRWARRGPCVLLIDHVPKDNERSPLYGIGSQRKRAAIDGASYMVEVVKPFAVGTDGLLRLVTAKDRNGNFPTGSVAAEAGIKSAEGGGVAIDIRAPQGRDESGRVVRPTVVMEKISRYLEGKPATDEIPAATSWQYELERAGLTKSKGTIPMALRCLVDEGHATSATVIRKGRESINYTLTKPFRSDTSPTSPGPPQDLPNGEV